MVEPLLCRCFRVPERVVREAIDRFRLTTVEEVRGLTRASSGCGSCYDDIRALLGERPVPARLDVSPARARAIVHDVIDGLDSGDVRIVAEGMDGTTVRARVITPDGDTSRREVLDVKRRLLERLSEALETRVTLLELNVLEEWEKR